MCCMYFCLEACLSLAFHAILCPVRLLLDIHFSFSQRVAFLVSVLTLVDVVQALNGV